MNPIQTLKIFDKLSIQMIANNVNENQFPINDLNNNELNIEEKVKVDRKKFEILLDGKDPDYGSAEKFFHKIMADFPSVVISWPPKLKSGAKSKKDPHIKICGIPSMVKTAKINILELLDPRRDRVTLKMDIDWTAHSHMIGKAGSSIQKVMERTGCHVHFPDANRTNTNEKSNQVSISGSASGVKEARIQIRQLLPVIVWFNLLLGVNFRSEFLDKLNRVIQLVEKLGDIQMTVRFSAATYQCLEFTKVTLFVRSTYGTCNLICLAIDLLVNYLDQFFIKDEIKYQISTEISSNHHNFITGFDGSKLNAIQRTTGADITFPEPKKIGLNEDIITRLTINSSPTQTSQSRKTTVTIKGSTVSSVLMAFHLIELQIPLSLTFDLKEGQQLTSHTIEMLSNRWNVFISVKPKPKQNTKTVWIKAPEKDESKLFEVRRYLIEQPETKTKPIGQIWFSDKIDFSIWHSVDNKENPISDIKTFDSSTQSGVAFERAPGAERGFKMF